MSANLRNFTRAVYGFDAVVRRVPSGGWDDPSPCEGWSARDVLAHQIEVLDGAARAARGEDIGLPQPPSHLAGPLDAWGRCRDGVLEALDHEGSLQRSGKYWFGEMSVDQLIGIVQWDPLTHAWDISRAVGLEPVPDDELYASSLATIEPMAGMLRKFKLIGEPLPGAADGSAMDRFLRLVGRDPAG
jgi:uncharacterized protein (TIGR03086 family)